MSGGRRPRLLLCLRLGVLSAALLATCFAALAYRRASASQRRRPWYAAVANPPDSTIRFRYTRNGELFSAVQRTNQWGLLGSPPPLDWDRGLTVLAVGGSSTHGLVLDYGKDWPARLQARLRARHQGAWVGNLGIPGHSTKGHLRTLEQFALRLRPDLLLFMVGGNDLWGEFGNAWRPRPPPALERSWAYRRVLLRSRLMQLRMDVAETFRCWSDPDACVASGGDVSFRPAPMPVSGVIVPDDAELSPLLPGLRVYRENVRALARLSRGRGVEPLFMTQPCLFADSPEWAGVFGHKGLRGDGRAMISARLIARMLGAYNRALLETCASERLECLDLNARVPHDPEHFLDPLHLTERGAARAGEEAARFLLASRALRARTRSGARAEGTSRRARSRPPA